MRALLTLLAGMVMGAVLVYSAHRGVRRQAARRTYVSHTTMHRYLSEGWTCDEDIVDRRCKREI